MSARYAHALPFGAELIDSSRTRFRLWAPDARTVDIEIPGLSPIAMHRTDEGLFEIEVYCGAGTCYCFRIDQKLSVPDPAARRQADDVHGESMVCDPKDYLWQCDRWMGRPWHEMVIYELHVGCCRGFSGVEKQLQELADLGVTAIELMPIADFSGQRNWGYDGVLPFAPDVSYGTPAELKRLIDSAHSLGICVYLDVVYNHFGPDGNYLGTYASPFFDATKHSPWGAAIDFSQPRVREFFTQNALYWLMEYRFDGLRFDAVHAISDANWLDEMAAQIRERIEPGRHVHLVLENENNCAGHLRGSVANPTENIRGGRTGLFDAQWNDDGHNVLHVLLTGEHDSYYRNYSEEPIKKLARCLSEGFIYQGEISPTLKRARGTSSAHLPPSAFVLFLQNHDQIGNRAFGERLTTLLGNESAGEQKLRAAITLLLLSPQIPLLFMGEQWGTRAPFLFFTDFHDELAAAVRDGRRREFSSLPAFADPVQREKIPDPNAVSTFTRSMPDSYEKDADENQRYFRLYRQLLNWRRKHVVPHICGCQSAGANVIGDAAVAASWRLGNGNMLHMAVNFGNEAIPLNDIRGDLLFASDRIDIQREKGGEQDHSHNPHSADLSGRRILSANSAQVFIEQYQVTGAEA